MKRRTTYVPPLVALVAGCSKAGSPRRSERAPRVDAARRVARGGRSEKPKSLNPLLAATTTDGFIDRLMFEPLITADPRRGDSLPDARRARSDDGQRRHQSQWAHDNVYRLRDDAHAEAAAVPVTSADVKWSWEAIVNPNDNVISRHGYDIVGSIGTPDARTVVVRLKRRFAPFVNTFFAESDRRPASRPRTCFRSYSNINQIPFNEAPNVSDGPFRFEPSWQHGERIVVTANPSFFEGRPGLQRVVVVLVPDENTATNLLRTHAID